MCAHLWKKTRTRKQVHACVRACLQTRGTQISLGVQYHEYGLPIQIFFQSSSANTNPLKLLDDKKLGDGIILVIRIICWQNNRWLSKNWPISICSSLCQVVPSAAGILSMCRQKGQLHQPLLTLAALICSIYNYNEGRFRNTAIWLAPGRKTGFNVENPHIHEFWIELQRQFCSWRLIQRLILTLSERDENTRDSDTSVEGG